MTARRRRLSDRALRVLAAIAEHGPLPTAQHPVLLAIAPGAGLYDSLLLLHTRYLVRWDQAGSGIRVTKTGIDTLRGHHSAGRR